MSDDRSIEVVDAARTNRRLDSWKAIADYLDRHVTTLQRWEHEEALPVHRHFHEKRGSVYAFTSELDAWLAQRADRIRIRRGARCAGGAAAAGIAAAPRAPDAQRHPVGQAPVEVPPQPVSSGAIAARPRVRLPVLAITAAVLIAVALTMAAGVAKDRWAANEADRAPALAVLPLSNRSPDLQPDYFVDGLTEALTTDLASVRAIRVIARQSVMQYRDTAKRASTIARELGVNVLVEGAVYRTGQRLRVDIRLIDGATSRSLWASTYERNVGEALALPADISRAIVSELHVPMPPSSAVVRDEHRRPSHPQALDAYLRARFFWNRRTHEDMGRAIEWYERAIQLDSSSPLLYAGLADVYATLGPRDAPVSELIALGTAAANRAIGLDPRMGEPYAALGKLRAYDWDWHGAESNYRKAIDRAPGYAPGRYWFGSFLANQGRCAEALEQAHEAERLDPLSLPGNMVIAGIELKCDRVPRAVTRVKTIIEFDPSFGQAYDYLGRAYLMQGNRTQAIDMFKRAQTLTGGRATIEAALGFAYAQDRAHGGSDSDRQDARGASRQGQTAGLSMEYRDGRGRTARTTRRRSPGSSMRTRTVKSGWKRLPLTSGSGASMAAIDFSVCSIASGSAGTPRPLKRRSRTLLGDVGDGDGLTALARARRRHADPQRFHPVVNRDRRLALLQDVLREVLQLVGVRVAETLHEVRHGVVRHAMRLGHHRNRRLTQVADANGSLEAKDLGRNVVAVNAAARQIDDAKLAAGEGQAGNRIIDIANRLELRIGDGCANRRDRSARPP